jgi:Tfp pilus assembly protein PilP
MKKIAILFFLIAALQSWQAMADSSGDKVSDLPENMESRIEPGWQGKKVILETYDLNALRVIGIVLKDDRYAPYALVQDTDGYIHRIFIGSRIGKNFGNVAGINKDSVWVQELVEIGEDWDLRMSQLMLVDSTCVRVEHESKNVTVLGRDCPEDLTAYDLYGLKAFEIVLNEQESPSPYYLMRKVNNSIYFRYPGVMLSNDEERSLQIKGLCTPYALIQDQNGYVHHAFIGSRIGRNQGVVFDMSKDSIYIRENISDNIGNHHAEQTTMLKLDTSVSVDYFYSIYCPKDGASQINLTPMENGIVIESTDSNRIHVPLGK